MSLMIVAKGLSVIKNPCSCNSHSCINIRLNPFSNKLGDNVDYLDDVGVLTVFIFQAILRSNEVG